MIKKILIIVVVIIVVAVAAFFGLMITSGIPSKGAKIAHYDNPRKALLVIDVQEGFSGAAAGPKSPHFSDAPKVIPTINRVIEKAAGKGYAVVYIKHEVTGPIDRLIFTVFAGGAGVKGNPKSAIDTRVRMVSENVFSKDMGDAFTNPALDAFMIKNRVNELYLTGLDAEYCVHATARGALNRGYKVHIITDAILLGNKKKWEGLLKEYKEEGIVLMKSGGF